jgi:hypothetical protein
MRHEPDNEYDRIVREQKLEQIARDYRDAMDVVRKVAERASERPPVRLHEREQERARA